MIGSPLRRPHRWLGLLAVPALLVTGCGDSASDDEETDVAADGGDAPDGAEAEPGVPVADSLVTPPGTKLLGTPFASQGSGYETNSVTVKIDALLQVVGDPLVAFGDLLDQAEAASIPMSVYAHGDTEAATCRVTSAAAPDGSGDRVPVGSEDLPEGPLGIECEASGVSAVSDGVQRRLELRSFVSEATDPYVSFVEVTLTEYEITTEPETLYADTVPSPPLEGESPVQPPDPPEPALLAQPGEQLGAPYAPEREDYQVLEGSLLLAPPSPPTCPTGGFLAVVRAEDELGAAFDRYSRELSGEAFRGVDEPDADQSFEHDGTRYRYRSYSAPGGGDIRVWAAPAPEGGTYLLVSRCND